MDRPFMMYADEKSMWLLPIDFKQIHYPPQLNLLFYTCVCVVYYVFLGVRVYVPAGVKTVYIIGDEREAPRGLSNGLGGL